MITRRRLAYGSCLFAGCRWIGGIAQAANSFDGLHRPFATIEAESGGRLGVAMLDTVTGAQTGHRADERFPMGSTFKLLAAGAVLARVDSGRESLERLVRIRTADVVANSPVTQGRVGDAGMRIGELCDAAITVSDNTAGNLLLASLGGPQDGSAALTEFARSLGDTVTRLDRIEPDLNEAAPNDPRDTTSPAAMLSDLRALTLGSALTPGSRDRLIAWLRGNKTGATRLRAGVPVDWRVADKTGGGGNGTTNDVGLIWPPGRAPVVASVYLTGTSATDQQRNATIAAVARAVVAALAGN